MQPDTSDSRDLENLAGFLQLIGNPLRLEILFCLLDQPMCVCDLTGKLNRRQPCISQHLMRLRQEGLVTARRDGWNQYYSISSENVKKYLKCLLSNWNQDKNIFRVYKYVENE